MKSITVLALSLLLGACSVTQLPDNLSRAMLNQDDPEVVADGAPAYLLMLDALILTYPENERFLLAGAQLYGAYAGVFAQDEVQAQSMADKALEYARRALCEYDSDACDLVDGPADELKRGLAMNYDEDDVDIFYAYGAAWAGWIQANTSDWNAIAQVSKVKNLMEWVESYDEGYDNATVQVYLGVLTTQLPPSVGGKPEIGKAHFEKAIALSDGKHLMAKVLYAKQYARLMFEQELHDDLLQQVIDADPYAEGLTLINRLAQRQADRLLAESTDYFE
ncbi:TRAP transporter T-component [Thalassolituus maritimus]|uniref:TRAP transporter T-component n=1 Tax=Thalassolituus maritimus TaxID=484498 RepID=A0A1N7PKT6_9GAMM|nr:TRAP transporter TatT component family protein [Thalassolituus maritimus]SIT10989.1 TRAP transporter T-component [Thalassolituus maritimus]